MRLSRLLLPALFVVLSVAVVNGQQQFQVFASIVDASGMPVKSLEPADVKVVENGVEATVTRIEPIEWPMKVQLLLDNGAGLGAENLQHLRNGVKGFLEAMPAGVEVAVLTTAPQARFVVRPTTDRIALLDGVGRLTPDSGTGRFAESLNEAAQRIEKDEKDHFPVIVMAGTSSGDTNVLERDIQRMMQRLQKRPATVHVILLTNARTASGGSVQTNVGLAVTQMTGGRYEGIAAASRLATLLPEIGAQIAKSNEKQSHQFRITVQRPAGASGDVGNIGMSVRSGLRAAGLSRDGRLP
jgi:von Willebrand factor type A domain